MRAPNRPTATTVATMSLAGHQPRSPTLPKEHCFAAGKEIVIAEGRGAGRQARVPRSSRRMGLCHKIPLLPQPCRISHNGVPGLRRPLARNPTACAGRAARAASEGGAMSQAIRQDAIYVLGYTDEERQRLTEQAELFRSCTSRLLQDAGLGPGAHVLDVGCGVGDVSILASSIVGPNGSVVGIDTDPRSLGFARQRVGERGLTNVTFTEGDFREFVP